MNEVQKKYAFAKAQERTLTEIYDEAEAAFIADSGYRDPQTDQPPKHLYQIEDDGVFEELCEAFSVDPANNWEEVNRAKDALRKAEDELIEYGLSLCPVKVQEKLRKACKTRLKTREKILDLAFRLDPTTVKKSA